MLDSVGGDMHGGGAGNLELAPQHAEALAGLDAVWCQGQLVSRAAWEQLSVQWRRGEGERKVWRRKLGDWADRIERPQTESGSEPALDRLRAVSDPEAVSVLCEVLAPRGEMLGLELATLLDRMAVPDATLALAWLAVNSEHEAVRSAAADRLRRKPLYEFVPPLLALMQLPVDSSYDIEVSRDGDHIIVRGARAGEALVAGAGVGVTGVDDQRADVAIVLINVAQMLLAHGDRRRTEAVPGEHAGDARTGCKLDEGDVAPAGFLDAG